MMKVRKLNQTSLAQAINVAQSAISNYCTGKRIPPMEEAMKIADILQVDVKWLLAWKESSAVMREKFEEAGHKVDSVPDISEADRQILFSKLVNEPIALELEGIRVNAELLARRIADLQERLFPKPKSIYRKKPASSKTSADAATVVDVLSEGVQKKNPEHSS